MKFNFEGPKKKILTTLGIVAAATPSMAQGPNANQKADEAFANTNKNKIEYTKTNNEEKPDLSKARKVNVIPEGYKTYKEGNKTIGVKITGSNKEVPAAKTGAIKGDNTDFLIAQLQAGVTQEELVSKGHASPEGIKKFAQYYKPASSIDVVYTEPEASVSKKEVDPYAAYAIKGEGVYLPGVSGHNAGQIYYLSMKSKNAYESGMTNTATEPFIIRLENPNGKYIDTTVMLKSIEDRNKYFDISGRHFINEGTYEALKKLGEEQMKSDTKEDKIQQLGDDYTTRADTVKFPGSK